MKKHNSKSQQEEDFSKAKMKKQRKELARDHFEKRYEKYGLSNHLDDYEDVYDL